MLGLLSRDPEEALCVISNSGSSTSVCKKNLLRTLSMEEQDHVVDFLEKKRQLEGQEVVLVLT